MKRTLMWMNRTTTLIELDLNKRWKLESDEHKTLDLEKDRKFNWEIISVNSAKPLQVLQWKRWIFFPWDWDVRFGEVIWGKIVEKLRSHVLNRSLDNNGWMGTNGKMVKTSEGVWECFLRSFSNIFYKSIYWFISWKNELLKKCLD